ncbi:MAG: hypothetical protein D6767_00330 [Candidatus Hydrogenedentota bacterium]|nr:MAG: hypothetical protein D6767_00330 [Candidatus Hydrogenedentota bacterium]
MSKVYEQYRKDKKSEHPSNAKNNRRKATLKIKIARYAYLQKEILEKKRKQKVNDNSPYVPMSKSSMTLPNFTAGRLKHYTIKLRKAGIAVNETELILACIFRLLPKLKANSRTHEANHQYNDKRYSYATVYTYCKQKLWNYIQTKSRNLKISASHLADIALRMYLELLVHKLLLTQGGKPTEGWYMHLRGFLLEHSYGKYIDSDRPKTLEVRYFTVWRPPKRQRDG